MTHSEKAKQILVVEDSPEDFNVLERAFKKAGCEVPLFRCRNGEEALELLYREGAFENHPKEMDPSLILLDLNMPGMDGHALLETVKDDNELKHIPIIVLSTSSRKEDVYRCYQNGANNYVQKPDDMKGYVEMAENIVKYWFYSSTLPA